MSNYSDNNNHHNFSEDLTDKEYFEQEYHNIFRQWPDFSNLNSKWKQEKQEGRQKIDEKDIPLISVSEAIRKHRDKFRVNGIISSISKISKTISEISVYCQGCNIFIKQEIHSPFYNEKNIRIKKCDKCNTNFDNVNPIFDYKNMIVMELRDIDSLDDLNHLSVLLFDKNIDNVKIGETVIVKGNISILNNGSSNNSRNKKLLPYLIGESIKYINRKELTLSKLDIKAIQKFALNDFSKKYNECSPIDKLASIFDHSIVGYDHIKKGLLMVAVNTTDDISKNQRLHALLIGDPGTSKSKMARRVTKLIPNSREENGQGSTGKTLIGIFDKTEDNTFLRLGAVPQARGAICAINEIGRQSQDDQGYFLDVMEEGKTTINKMGMHADIVAPTSIVATANPINNSKWINNDKIDFNEFPILAPLIDRFDMIFTFRDKRREDNKKEVAIFTKKFSEISDKIEKKQLPDYTPFLTKYIQYAKQINPVISHEARIMLEEYCNNVYLNHFGSPRIQPRLNKIVKAIAKLKLKEEVDEEDAKEAMEFYNVILSDFQKSVLVSQSPRDLAFNECVFILEKHQDSGGITIEELIKKVCEKNEQLANYFGYGKKSLKIRNNKKIHNIYDMLLNHSNIKKIHEKPVILRWISNRYDPCDRSSFSSLDLKKSNDPVESTISIQ